MSIKRMVVNGAELQKLYDQKAFARVGSIQVSSIRENKGMMYLIKTYNDTEHTREFWAEVDSILGGNSNVNL